MDWLKPGKQEVGKLENWKVVRKLKRWKVRRWSNIGREELCKCVEIYSMKFYHNSVSGLKVKAAERDDYGKKRGGLEILFI